MRQRWCFWCKKEVLPSRTGRTMSIGPEGGKKKIHLHGRCHKALVEKNPNTWLSMLEAKLQEVPSGISK